MNKFNFNKLTPFKWFVLENFPFIEADFDALTEWQLFCKLGKEMNKIIDSENTLGTQMENVTNAFIELQNYVNDYFKNLDVQDEINNKLNEMAESGELTEIIAQYLQLAGLLCFNTVEDLKKANNIVDGSFVKTFGFYKYNDLGGSFYKIRQITNQDIVNETNIISLNDKNLIAELILNDKMNILQFGINENNSNKINEFINLLENKTLLFNNVDYKLNQDLILPSNIKLIGNNTTISSDDDIILNDNNIIDNIIFNSITPITRNDKGYITNQISCRLYGNQKNNIIIKNCSGNGLFIELGTCNNCIIDNCKINAGYSNAGSITIINNCLNCKVLNTEVYGANYDAISIYRCNNIIVDNCKLHNNGHSGTWTPYTTNLLISNTISHDNGCDGFDMNFGADEETMTFKSDSKLLNNKAYNNDATGCYICGSSITLDGNKFYDNGTNGLRIRKWLNSDNSKGFNIILTNNIIENNNKKLNENGSSLTHNVLLENVENSLIENNIIRWTEENSTQEYNLAIFGGSQINLNNNICLTTIVNKVTTYLTGCQILNLIDNGNIINNVTNLKTSKLNVSDLVFDKQNIYRPGTQIPSLPNNWELGYATNGYGTYYLIFKTQNDGLKFIQLGDAT